MSIKSCLLVVFAAVLLAVPATAEIYIVTLTNGAEFHTQYRPKEAGWDTTKIMLLTDVGNWIAIELADVASVTSELENEGFGKVIDTSTIAIGWSPNDAPDLAAQEAADPMTRLLNFLSAEQGEAPDYSVQQFVDPSEAGAGGLPVSGLTSPGTGVSNFFGVGDTSFPVRSGGNTVVEPRPIDQ